MAQLRTKDWTEIESQVIFECIRDSLREAEKLGLMEVQEDLGAVDELERRLQTSEEDPFVLPVSVTEAIRLHFGSGQRTFKALVKRVRFAYKVWQGKYGPWTPEQAEYAEELILWAINQAPKGTDAGHSRALVYTALDRILHHENTHEGFRRREAEGVDISDDLREALGA